jgi:hypothetical protein
MKAFRLCVIALSSVILMGWIARAEDKPAEKTGPKNSAFEKIKALAGDWEAVAADKEHGHGGGVVNYKVTAGGSTVLETLFGGTDHEMITMYYMDGDTLTLTHYCILQNRPLMRAERQLKPDQLVFKCQDVDNAKIADQDHMHQATFTFVDGDHLKTEWVLYKGGKPDGIHGFELVRKKKK